MNTKLKIANTIAALTLATSLVVSSTAANAGDRGCGGPSSGQAFRAFPVGHVKSNVVITGKTTLPTFRYEPRREARLGFLSRPAERSDSHQFIQCELGTARLALRCLNLNTTRRFNEKRTAN